MLCRGRIFPVWHPDSEKEKKNNRIILTGVAFGIVGFGILVSHYHPDISDLNESIAMDLIFSGDTAALSTEPSEAPTADDRLHWYDSADEAMRDGSLVREESYVPYDQLTNSVGIAESTGQGMAFTASKTMILILRSIITESETDSIPSHI